MGTGQTIVSRRVRMIPHGYGRPPARIHPPYIRVRHHGACNVAVLAVGKALIDVQANGAVGRPYHHVAGVNARLNRFCAAHRFRCPERYAQGPRAHFGRDAASYPIIATEWNAVETNGRVDGPLPEIALSLVRYLQHMHIGLIGWAIDSEHGKLVKDHIHFEPTNYDDFQGCSGKNRPSLSGAGRLLAAFPNN